MNEFKTHNKEYAAMFDWVSGASRSQQDEGLEPDEVPETPAHIFAARAFKSLLFGTPAPNDMTIEKTKRFTKVSGVATIPRRHSSDLSLEQFARPTMQPRHSDPLVSPSKGILVPPGSVSTKRKNVTFGGLGGGAEQGETIGVPPKLNVMETLPEKEIAPLKSWPEIPQEDLRRSLFQARKDVENVVPTEGQPIGNASDNAKESRLVNKAPNAQALNKLPPSEASIPQKSSRSLEDQTIDLNQPRSTSGQHWKREYERDHDNSKAEMKRLIQYNQMTKSYAEKRDRDATVMTQKLNETEAKAKSLEKKIQRLAAQLMDAKTQGKDQDNILCEVASQTAEVMKYKSKADRYRAALRRNEVLRTSTDEDDEVQSQKRPSEAPELKLELAKLKLAAERAEARAAKVEEENASLSAMLQQMKVAKQDLSQQYDQLNDRVTKKEGRLWEENERLTRELQVAKVESISLREQLESIREANRVNGFFQKQSLRHHLPDSRHSKSAKEPSPPTSDEDLRVYDPLLDQKELSQIDWSLSEVNFLEQTDHTYAYKAKAHGRRRSHAGNLSSNLDLDQGSMTQPQATPRRDAAPQRAMTAHVDAANYVHNDSMMRSVDQRPPINTPLRKSSPLMKSFIDNLGTRQALPPERIAAAKKRLEEKAAARRSTPKYNKAQDRMGA